MAELEKDTTKKLKICIRYVDDNLLLVNDGDIDPILKNLNSYNKNIKPTVDRFINEDVHFLDIKIQHSYLL